MVKKRAFTLVEVIISMMIIMIIAIGSLPVLTKSKPQIESVTLRGQYGCWIENGKLYEWYFDERTPRTKDPMEVDSCTLKLDERPANFYILASGAGNNVMHGQVKTQYSSALSNELSINLGKTALNENHTTTVSSGASAAEVSASGSPLSSVIKSGFANATTGVVKENLGANTSSCKLVSAPPCAKSCEVVDVIQRDFATGAILSNSQNVRINGCYKGLTSSYDAFGNQISILIPLETLSYSGLSGSFDPNIVSAMAQNAVSRPNNYKYISSTYDWNNGEADDMSKFQSGNDLFMLNFKFDDSSYVPPQNYLGYSNNIQYLYAPDSKSKMTKIIETIPIRRKSALTEKLININPGALNKDGAVLILW